MRDLVPDEELNTGPLHWRSLSYRTTWKVPQSSSLNFLLLLLLFFFFSDFNYFPSITTYVKYFLSLHLQLNFMNSRNSHLLNIGTQMSNSHLQPQVFKPRSSLLFLLKLLFFSAQAYILILTLFNFVLYLKLLKIPKSQFFHL